MGDGPGDTGHRNGDKEQCDDLVAEGHLDKDGRSRLQVACRFDSRGSNRRILYSPCLIESYRAVGVKSGNVR